VAEHAPISAPLAADLPSLPVGTSFARSMIED
jgi:hypothetical protein